MTASRAERSARTALFAATVPEGSLASETVAEAPPVRVWVRNGIAAWRFPLDRRELVRVLAAMGALALALGHDGLAGGVELYLVDDAAISAANHRCLGCPGPTNVLSFPGAGGLPGALLLSAETHARECLLYGQPPRPHALRLLAHGMAHLAGLDHGRAMDRLCAAFHEQAAAALSAMCGGRHDARGVGNARA